MSRPGYTTWKAKVYGVFLFCTAMAMTVPAQTTKTVAPAPTFTILHSFSGTDGSDPGGALIQGTDGNLLGTTVEGGANGRGTIFKMSLTGAVTDLHSFDLSDGAGPSGGLLQASNGSFYGTTGGGGAQDTGTVFGFSPRGTFTLLYSFCSLNDCEDGNDPTAPLVQGNNAFYGTAIGGGINGGGGIVFKITPTGVLTTLHSFDGTDGSFPEAPLVLGSDGNFYGTTSQGGAFDSGTVFNMTPTGALTVLHSFDGTDGGAPFGGLVEGTDGNFYGTTQQNGAITFGTVFAITPAGVLTTLHNFDYGDGYEANGALIQATDGNFYGTTLSGGASGDGTIFEITPAGVLTTLHNFDGTDGQSPSGTLLQDTNGIFYGTAPGGPNEEGVVFSLSVGLGPFVVTEPTSGVVGATVTILGTNLTGSTRVTFHGVEATFTVVSSSEITATVPPGATSGVVMVATPGGTLSSNKLFHVRP